MRIAWLMSPIGHPETPTVSMVPPPPLHLKVALSWVVSGERVGAGDDALPDREVAVLVPLHDAASSVETVDHSLCGLSSEAVP